jgi:chemotaxis signal transduction protein
VTGGGDAAGHLVLFEVGGSAYALPIAHVLEVGEMDEPAAIPTLSPRLASVVNHHGDALPLVAREALFASGAEGLPAATRVLVIGVGPDQTARLGLPVDRVLGIVPGFGPVPAAAGLVAERRHVEGRVVALLDAARLLREAQRIVASERESVAPEGREG